MKMQSMLIYFISIRWVKIIQANPLVNNESFLHSILEYSLDSSHHEDTTISMPYDLPYFDIPYFDDYDPYDYDWMMPGLDGNDEVVKKQESICEDNGWKLLIQDDRTVLDVCLESEYQVNHPPIEDKVLNLYTTFNYQKLLKVDESQQAITMDIKEWTFWKDARIKTTFKHDNESGKSRDHIGLKTKPLQSAYPIWTPSRSCSIRYFFHIKSKISLPVLK